MTMEVSGTTGLCLLALATALSAAVEVGPAPEARGPLLGARLYPHPKVLCGPIALYLAARSAGIQGASVAETTDACSFSGKTMSVAQMAAGCARIGLHSCAVETNAAGLARALSHHGVEAVILTSDGHFCYVHCARAGRFWVSAFPMTPAWWTTAELQDVWTGTAVLISRDPISAGLVNQSPLAAVLLCSCGGAIIVCGAGLAFRGWRRSRRI